MPLHSDLDDDASDTPVLPIYSTDEFRPFIRSLPEFKFWLRLTCSTLLALGCTLCKVLDLPTNAVILALYITVLFVFTMMSQISHMVKHRYLPFSLGKKTYN